MDSFSFQLLDSPRRTTQPKNCKSIHFLAAYDNYLQPEAQTHRQKHRHRQCLQITNYFQNPRRKKKKYKYATMFLKEARKLAGRQVRKTMSMLGYAEQWGPRRSQDFWIPLAFCTLPFSSSTIPFFKCHAGLDMVVEMVTPGRGKERQG